MSFLKEINQKTELLETFKTELFSAKAEVLKTFKIDPDDFLFIDDVFSEEPDAKWFHSDGVLFIFFKDKESDGLSIKKRSEVLSVESGIKDINQTLPRKAPANHAILSDDQTHMIVMTYINTSEWDGHREYTILRTDNEILFEKEAIEIYDEYKINSNPWHVYFKVPTFENFRLPVQTFDDWLNPSQNSNSRPLKNTNTHVEEPAFQRNINTHVEEPIKPVFPETKKPETINEFGHDDNVPF